MADPHKIAGRVEAMRLRDNERDAENRKVLAIRDGDYETVAPGLFPPEFDKPLVANLIDTSARDIAEVMAPLPSINCLPSSTAKDAERKRAEKRSAIANSYVQISRLQDQMYEGTDRYGSFGFLAYVVEPSFDDNSPIIRVDDSLSAHYTCDYRGRVREYANLYTASPEQLIADYPEHEATIRNLAARKQGQELEVVRWYDDQCQVLMLMESKTVLVRVDNPTGKCPVRVVERPTIGKTVRGQFNDVIWVQVARALVQMYTMNALEQSVNAPIALPDDVQQLEIGPNATLQSKNPEKIGRIPLNIPTGVFPEQQILAQEQRTGSRYPEGRSGSIDASIVTGQGVQALMGTFDTQVQTFQRLNASALEDVICMCFEMDEKLWGGRKKSVRVKDAGSPRKVEYTPSKDIDGDYTVDVSYGAIAGLDPNRGLVFLLQALAGGLISKNTSRRFLPVELNVVEEERQIDIEGVRDSLAASVAALAQGIPMMASQGMDPRELVVQLSEVMKQRQQGASIEDAVQKVFAPKEDKQQQPVSPVDELLGSAGAEGEQSPQQGGAAAQLGQGGASDLLMSLVGMSPGGNPNLQSTVSRRQPI